MTEIINTRLLQTSKGARVWLEGTKLDAMGYKKGDRYSTSISGNTITIKLNSEGEKKISGRNRNGKSIPIFDLCGKWLSKIFSHDDLIVAQIQENQILIKRHKESIARSERENRFFTSSTLKEGVLCAGGGISAHAINKGLHDSGFSSDVALIMERETKYLQVAAQNNETMQNADVIVHGNIEDCDVDDLPQVDVLSFSLPCTGHSPQGKTKNGIKMAEEHSKDSAALFGAIRVIRQTNPSIILSENVIQAQSSATYTLLKAELKRLQYDVFEIILDESDSIGNERRKRYWMAALTKTISHGFKLDSVKEYLPENKPYTTIGDLLDTDIDESRWFSPETFEKREAVNAKAGRGFKCNFVTDEDETVGVIPRNYTKRQVSNPHYLNEETGQIRLFTPKEHARIKGIPTHLIEGAADTTAHEILGQSILYHHAYCLTRAIAEHSNLYKNILFAA